MPLKTILFLALFATCVVGALWMPLLGVLGYVGHYCIGPERQWWEAPISHLGIRYSYTLAIATAIGIAMNWRKLRFGRSLFTRHEWLILLFLGVVWLSTLTSEETTAFYTMVDHPSVKMTKVVIFLLMMSHVVTTPKRLDALLWVLIAGALILGLQAFTTPYSQFTRGRLEAVGGADFSEANFLAAFLASMLPLIGVQFLRSRWVGRIVCLVSGVFATNAIILTRSRGAMVGIAAGAIVAIALAPRQHRTKILIGLAIAVAGGIYITDPGFINRASTITMAQEDMDASSVSRIEIWKASGKLFSENLLGVGAGNFFQAIGKYDARLEGRDAHSTPIRCCGELGIQGMALYLLLIVNAFVILIRVARRAGHLPAGQGERILYMAYGLAVALVAYLASGLTMTLLYVEAQWWFLGIPVCLERVLDNLERGREAGLLPAAKAS